MTSYTAGDNAPRPPTLEEIVKIFTIAKDFRFTEMEHEGDIVVRFRVSKKDCEDLGVHLVSTAGAFINEVRNHLDRLSYFEDLAAKFAEPQQYDTMSKMRSKSHTPADLIAFMNNELKFLQPGGLDGTLRRKMFIAVNEKLAELQEWRVFMDKERMDSMRKKQRAQEEAVRKQQEEMHQQQEKARKEEAKNTYDEFKEKYDKFKDQYRSAFSEEAKASDWFNEFRRGAQDRAYDGAFYGRDPYEEAKPGGNRWFDILGIKPNATKDEIKKAWRKLAKQYHPDRQGGDSKKMAEINAAKDEGLAGAPA